MQNLSASDLMSLELGFQTAREDTEDEPRLFVEATGDSSRAPTASCGAEQPSGEDGENNVPSDDVASADEREGRLGSSRAERANKWRRNETLWKAHQLRADHLENSISRLMSDIESDTDKGRPPAIFSVEQQHENEEEEEEEENACDNVVVDSRLTAGSPRPAIRICVETCGSSLESLVQIAEDGSLERTKPAGLHHQSSPNAPPPSRSSSSLDLRNLELKNDPNETLNVWRDNPLSLARSTTNMQSGEQDLLLLSVQQQDTGSLSDGAYKLTKYSKTSTGPHSASSILANRRRFENWKRANKLITNIHENPFNLHMDCLDRLGALIVEPAKSSERSYREQTTQTSENDAAQQQRDEAHHQTRPNDLSNYANNLTHLYRKNRETMDSSTDFRTLLYNIICCLLVQDDQVLSTVSVSKMLDVIRTHLESASKVYANTSNQLLSNLAQQVSQKTAAKQEDSSLMTASSSSSMSCETLAANSLASVEMSLAASHNFAERPERSTCSTVFMHQLSAFNQHKKPANFRRISSVSYNDEQLINDLRDEDRAEIEVRRSGSLSAASGQQSAYSPSPWAYRELSDRRQSGPRLDSAGSSSRTTTNTTAHYTSQSSLEQTISQDPHQNELMNDSGNGTMCDSQVVSDFADYGSEASRRRASFQSTDRAMSLCCESFGMMQANRARRRELGRRLSDFKPMQQPSYMSTDDYLSTTNHCNNQRTSFYDDENSSSLQKCDFGTCKHAEDGTEDCPLDDVAARRAELEWTLNKLINIELKLTWLTSKDTLRRAIRKIGVPNEIRGKVWLILIDQMIGTRYDVPKLLEQARETIEKVDEKLVAFDDDTLAILKQIELDVNRTMPGHRLFDDGAEGGVKLRRILVAYSIHVNRAIAYCQGFNFIVALLLSVFEGDETHALRGFICIVDHIFPSKYYFDHYLTGARADQFLLADFICDQLIKSPTMAERKMVEGVTSSITLNWFISLFHGAVPTLTRLTILDHFMLEGVKALFRFTMAILYLAFQVTPPSSAEIFTTIRNTAKDMYDIKLLLSIVDQIKLPKDSYFAIRRSFYMVQSSFNSDQFYMQALSSDANRNLVANKPLSCQQLSCSAKPPALSLISSSSFIASATSQSQHQSAGCNQFTFKNSVCQDSCQRPRTRISADRTKICIQSIGKLGRSHLRIIDTNARNNERSLMSPLRNCILIGISNCGKNLVIARQSSKRNFRSFKEQDLIFHIHEISTEIFDGFFLEESQQALIITHPGEIFKIDCRRCFEDNKLAKPNYLEACTETLLLRDTGRNTLAEHEKVKLRLSTMDTLTNLLWIYVEAEGYCDANSKEATSIVAGETSWQQQKAPISSKRTSGPIMPKTAAKFRLNNPFLDEVDELGQDGSDFNNNELSLVALSGDPEKLRPKCESPTSSKPSFSRKIIIVDIITFDLFSVFAVHPNFGEITNLRASLVAFCQLSNPMSNQFSTRIVQIGPTGRYEQLLSFSDVADYMVSLPESFKRKYNKQTGKPDEDPANQQQQRYSSIRRFLTHSISFSSSSLSGNKASLGAVGRQKTIQSTSEGSSGQKEVATPNTLTRYYRSLMRSYSTCSPEPVAGPGGKNRADGNKLQEDNMSSLSNSSPTCDTRQTAQSKKQAPKLIQDGALRSIISSSFGDFSELSETNYIPVNMAFIFRNGKIALFEFTESYAIHTREAQLDRYDYSRVVDVTKNGEDFIVTILTVCDKLIKVII